ncbi:hypothetical protein LZD49_02170 [Dyadobacter sp. CY261]|uniref:hypothetical protein n=1 Tax=Dyadobacter sp. CY261 TaxID=2907203 RepID=UPI001F3E1D76|nr:hypothetical protein [Dyadobacter sp. CY261]MCF0069259.1 hypothetical protein [Dyadobacter sp. CY261]
MTKASLCLIITLLSFGAAGQTLRWNYPCKPGTECWSALTSVEERQNACQITGIDLNTLSTEELLLITMEHPFFRSYVLHDSPIDGMGFSLEGFNGYEAFVARKDAVETLAEVYTREDFTKVKQMRDSVQIGNYTLKWTGLELLMTDQKLLSKISGEEGTIYLKQIHDKLLVKTRLTGFFGGTSFATSALVFYRLAKNLGYEIPQDILSKEGIDLFEKKLIVTNSSIVTSLLAHFDRFVERH